MLVKEIVGSEPKKVSPGSFYGIHFHNLIVHAPVIYRIIAIRSLLAEQDESTIYRLRKITDCTSSRRPDHVIDNALMRMTYADGTAVQTDSVVSKEAQKVHNLG